MGAPVALRRWLAGGALLLLAGCEPKCEPVEKILALPAPYSQFFNGLPACGSISQRLVAASSSTGLTDNFTGGCINDASSYSYTEPCALVRAEQRRTYAVSSLYGFNFGVRVEQYPNGPLLLLSDQTSGTGALHAELTYHFATGVATGSYRDPASNNPVPFGQPPVVTELTNFLAGGRTYPQVWRVTNPLNASRSRTTAAAVLYVARDYGLIRFEQRDGTVWTLTL